MIPCQFCRRGWLTLVRTEVKHAKGVTGLTSVACDTCGKQATLRDAADYYQERSVKGPNLFEEKAQ